MTIKRNQDGSRNIRDLRKALEQRDDVMLVNQGGSWILHRWNEHYRAYIAKPLHYRHGEREALEIALFGEVDQPY